MELSKCIYSGCVMTYYSECSSSVAVITYTLLDTGLRYGTLEVYFLGLCRLMTYYSEYSSSVAVTTYTLLYTGLQHETLQVYFLGLCNHVLQ